MPKFKCFFPVFVCRYVLSCKYHLCVVDQFKFLILVIYFDGIDVIVCEFEASIEVVDFDVRRG